VVENDILYRKFCHPDGTTNYLQIVLPSVLRQPYCKRLHADLGHIGQTKTCLAFSSRAYFPGWRSYLRLLVRKCTVCNLSTRASNTTKQAPMQPMQELRPMALSFIFFIYATGFGPVFHFPKEFYRRSTNFLRCFLFRHLVFGTMYCEPPKRGWTPSTTSPYQLTVPHDIVIPSLIL